MKCINQSHQYLLKDNQIENKVFTMEIYKSEDEIIKNRM